MGGRGSGFRGIVSSDKIRAKVRDEVARVDVRVDEVQAICLGDGHSLSFVPPDPLGVGYVYGLG